MRAVTLVPDGTGRRAQYSTDVPAPEPGPGQLRVTVRYASVNFSDLLAASRPGPAEIPGLDACGLVESVGAGVPESLVGKRVAVFCDRGGYADQVVVPQELAWVLPDDVDWDQAAAFPTVGVTAWNMLTSTAAVRPGETVFVPGAGGGAGNACVQVARVLGVGSIIGAVGSPAKVDFARESGCDHVLVGSEAEELQPGLAAAAGSTGLQVAVDGTGGGALAAGLAVLDDFGRFVVYGRTSGQVGEVDPRQIHQRNQSLLGYSTRGMAKHRPLVVREAGLAALGLMRRGLLTFAIDGTHPLADVAEAHERIRSRQSMGKILLQVSAD